MKPRQVAYWSANFGNNIGKENKMADGKALCYGKLGHFISWHVNKMAHCNLEIFYLCDGQANCFVSLQRLYVQRQECYAWTKNQQHGMKQSVQKNCDFVMLGILCTEN